MAGKITDVCILTRQNIYRSNSIKMDELVLDGINSGVLAEEDEGVIIKPFDPKKIAITKKNIALDVIVRRMNQGSIRLSPDFQRNTVWSNKQKSQLIESLMLNIPIPLFYVSADEEGKWDVVDGLQRLTAIREYLIDKELVLSDLEFWKEYEKTGIDDLPPVIFNRIYETEFTFVIIEPGTPELVKYNVFKRINTGGKPLTPQEIRNALYNGKGTQLLRKLVKEEAFTEATGNSINDGRMTAQECVLRYLSFLMVGPGGFFDDDYSDSFLNRNLQILNRFDEIRDKKNYKLFNDGKNPPILVDSYEELVDLFEKGLNRNRLFFGENAFRLMSITAKKRTPINRVLLETLGSLFARLHDDEFNSLLANKDYFMKEYDSVRISNEFYRAISRDPWIKENVDYRFNKLNEIIRDTLQ